MKTLLLIMISFVAVLAQAGETKRFGDFYKEKNVSIWAVTIDSETGNTYMHTKCTVKYQRLDGHVVKAAISQGHQDRGTLCSTLQQKKSEDQKAGKKTSVNLIIAEPYYHQEGDFGEIIAVMPSGSYFDDIFVNSSALQY